MMVTPIGLGAWQFANRKGIVAGSFWPSISQQAVEEIVDISLKGGINWFDTAEVYGKGNSEMALARALKESGKAPDEVIVATKWWPFPRTAGSIRRNIDERLRFLDGFGVDLYQVHQPWSLSSIEAQMNAMADLVDDGRIGGVGVSNFSAGQMIRAHQTLEGRGTGLLSNQVRYSLLRREIESNGVMEAAKELGITIIAYSPLEQGILTGKFHRDPSLLDNVSFMRKRLFMFGRKDMERSRPLVERVGEIATSHGATSSQVALCWLLEHHGDTVVAIPGASKPSHAEQNVGALSLSLSSSEMEELDQMSTGFM
jgi:aryl-alcohol dehydrogenase-like predicted oxidoreductase